MKSSELDYELPPELVAQRPAERRDASRLLVYDRQTGAVRHRTFAELPAELPGGRRFTPTLRSQPDVERVTRHVGLDTFRPLSTDTVEEHRIHGERYEVRQEAWERIRAAGRVLAVGTTTVRVLETLVRGGPLA